MSIPGVTFLPFNLDNRNWVKRVSYMAQPDVVIFAAGNSDKDWAEANARAAEQTHSGGAATLANATDMMQPRFIYLSTPYVFDGSRGNYHESDTVLPSTVYGRMKLGGENVVRSKCLNYVILRSSPLFGRGNGLNLSFLDHLRRNLSLKNRVEISHRELHNFASITGLCNLIVRLIDSGVRNRILHYGGLTKITYFEFAKLFAERFGFDSSLISFKAMPHRKGNILHETPPLDFSLNCTQATETLKIKPLLLEESFDLIEKQLISHL